MLLTTTRCVVCRRPLFTHTRSIVVQLVHPVPPLFPTLPFQAGPVLDWSSACRLRDETGVGLSMVLDLSSSSFSDGVLQFAASFFSTSNMNSHVQKRGPQEG
ncbi:unnamed protein product [Durusdinium trenchii]|uniref:Uncharacterized protein n=1 Tax=Durusdinium trenchii TaxID=1381693 RepID=A0ABP0RCU1_9DINO